MISSTSTYTPWEAILPDMQKRGVSVLSLHEISGHGHYMALGTSLLSQAGLVLLTLFL